MCPPRNGKFGNAGERPRQIAPTAPLRSTNNRVGGNTETQDRKELPDREPSVRAAVVCSIVNHLTQGSRFDEPEKYSGLPCARSLPIGCDGSFFGGVEECQSAKRQEFLLA